MYKQRFGTNGQIQFDNENQYYQLLGYLAKSNGSTSIVWEHNEDQGAWGSEGRIQIHTHNMPQIGHYTLTAGNGGNVISRINCNEFVANLRVDHKFRYGKTQDIDTIRTTIPDEYLTDFESGLNIR